MSRSKNWTSNSLIPLKNWNDSSKSNFSDLAEFLMRLKNPTQNEQKTIKVDYIR